MIEIRDEKGEVFNRVERPAVVMDRDCGTVLIIGEWETMETYFEDLQKKYRELGFDEAADDIVLVELPKEQEEVDKVFQNTGYMLRIYKEAIKGIEEENENDINIG